MRKKTILTLILILSISLNAYLIHLTFIKKSTENQNPAQNSSPLRFVKPINNNFIDSNISESSHILHYADLKPSIESIIDSNATVGSITGFFLQDISTGAWLGNNEKEGFAPASLLKIPIAMTILKRVDRDEIKLTDTIELTEEDLDNDAGNLYKKGAGTKLTFWEAIKIMILTSDNTAKNALKRQVSDAEINAIFTHIGIPNPYLTQNSALVTPRGYIRIFKSLYFATFISPELSEKLLDLATDTQAENLISAGIPPEIQVSHKYGEHPDGLADCGIVYEPKNPYMLCIMTQNIEISEAKNLINSLSKTVFDYIHNK